MPRLRRVSSGFLNLTSFLGLRTVSEFCLDARIDVLFQVSFSLGADPSTARWPAGAPEQSRSLQPHPSSCSFQNKPCWGDLPPWLHRLLLARVYYHSAIELVCWEQDSASCRLKSTSCFCPGQGPARRTRGVQVGVFGSVLGMQRDRASGSPAAEVQGAFCLSENQIIYYQK